MPVTKKLIPVLALALVWGCTSKTEEKPAESAPQPQAAAPAAEKPAEATQVAAADAAGEKVFKGTCSMCHASGAAGAPKMGDKADWGPRIAQGKDVLYKHALEGFTGSKGQMPARGGNTSLKDDDVKAAVDYMASKAL